MPNLHPILVHFAVALFFTAVLFDLAGYFTKKDSLKAVGWWNLLVATVFAVPTVITGLVAEASLPHTDEIHRLMQTHKTLGLLALGMMVVLLVWRSINRGILPVRLAGLFLLVGVLGLATMTTGAYYGGEMVYVHGMGVTPMMEQMMADHGQALDESGEGHQHQAETADTGTYACPMHPEVTADEPGNCPKCGMALKEVSPGGEGHHEEGQAGEEDKQPNAGNNHGDHEH